MRDSRLRVLVVTTALVPDQLHTWEAASHVDGVDLHIAGSLVHDAEESYSAPLGVPSFGTTHVLDAKGWVSRGRLWWNLEGLDRLIAEVAPDVVHVHSEVWGRLVGQSLESAAPVVAHGAENVSLDHGGRLEAKIRVRMAHRNAERLAGYASWNRAGVELLQRNGLRPGAPTAVAPAIVPDPAPFLAAVPAELPADRPPEPSGPVRVGYLGRLVPEKGVQWLVSALDGVPGVRLVVVGSGPYEGEIRRQAARRGIDAEFVSAVEPDRMPGVIAGLDIVVVPSLVRPGWAEQFGRVVCEAMLVGVPVISSDSGSLADVVGEGGIVVPELDHRALRVALLGLIDDPEARRTLGARGREWALAHLVPDAAARSLVTLWTEVAAVPK